MAYAIFYNSLEVTKYFLSLGWDIESHVDEVVFFLNQRLFDCFLIDWMHGFSLCCQ